MGAFYLIRNGTNGEKMNCRKFLVVSWLEDKVYIYVINSDKPQYISLNYKIDDNNQSKINNIIIKYFLFNFDIDYVKIKDCTSSYIYIYQADKFKESFSKGIDLKPLISYSNENSLTTRFGLINKMIDTFEETDKRVKEQLKNDRPE